MARLDPISALLSRNAGGHGPVMLMYHSVQPGTRRPEWPWAVSMPQFRSHLDLLVSLGWMGSTVRELAANLDSGAPDGRTVVITFDDGYADNLAACEELQARGMRATLFMVSGSLGRQPAWPADGRPAGRLLNAGELRALHAAGIEIGSHTVNHCRLPEVSDLQLRSELGDSKAALEDVLGQAVDSLAYPYGASDVRCERATQAAGYMAACTTRSGWATRERDPLRLRRISVFNTDTVSIVARKLAFANNDVSWRHLAGYFRSRISSRLGQGARA